MKFLFRTNASAKIGFGHLTRCRALAMALRQRGHRCMVVGPQSDCIKQGDGAIFDEWLPDSQWPSSHEAALSTIGIANRYKADWLVLDDYRVDESYQLAVREAGIKWLQFDAAASMPLWADIIINANPAIKAADYTSVLCNREAHLLLGPSYAVVRQDFFYSKPPATFRWPAKKILVTFGGGDDRGLIEFVLSSLVPLTEGDVQFVVISGLANPNNDRLKFLANSFGQGRVSLHIDPNPIAPLFASCDLAVMAGGTSTYEAACSGVPMILVSIAGNQIPQSKAWADLNAAVYLGDHLNVSRQTLEYSFRNILHNSNQCNALASRARHLCDGMGSHRVALCIDSVSSS